MYIKVATLYHNEKHFEKARESAKMGMRWFEEANEGLLVLAHSNKCETEMDFKNSMVIVPSGGSRRILVGVGLRVLKEQVEKRGLGWEVVGSGR